MHVQWLFDVWCLYVATDMLIGRSIGSFDFHGRIYAPVFSTGIKPPSLPTLVIIAWKDTVVMDLIMS